MSTGKSEAYGTTTVMLSKAFFISWAHTVCTSAKCSAQFV